MISVNYNNFLIYYNNLSMYYAICLLVSIIAIIVSWYFHFKKVPLKVTKDETKIEQSMAEKEDALSDETRKIVEEQIDAIISETMPRLKQNTKDALDKISAGMTTEQLQAEREAEQEQLSAILKLLKKQEDKFQVGSMEELEGQLKLYR